MPAATYDLLTTDEVAAMLRVSRWTVHRWHTSGTLRGVKIGRAIRYHRADVDAFVGRRAAS